MKELVLRILVASLCILKIQSQVQPSLEIQIENGLIECEAPSKIAVVGQGAVSVPSDMATISLSIEGLAPTVIEARNSVANTSQQVSDALSVLVKPENIYPTSVTIAPQQREVRGDEGQIRYIVDGYKYSNALDLQIDNVTSQNIAIILDSAAFAGQRAVNIQRITFSLSPEVKLNASKEARVYAIKDAKEKAAEYAKEMNATLGTILSLSEIPPNSAAAGVASQLPGYTPPRSVPDMGEGTTITINRNELTSVIFMEFLTCPL